MRTRATRYMTRAERLDFYTDQSGGADTCWMWTGKLNGGGYGRLEIAGKQQFAHRAAWEEANGPIPVGMCVCHRCDNRACVNPAHMFVGTIAENNADRDRKGRQCRGEVSRLRAFRVARRKLTDEQVAEIRAAAVSRPTHELAEQFGIHPTYVNQIASGRRRTVSREVWA